MFGDRMHVSVYTVCVYLCIFVFKSILSRSSDPFNGKTKYYLKILLPYINSYIITMFHSLTIRGMGGFKRIFLHCGSIKMSYVIQYRGCYLKCM